MYNLDPDLENGNGGGAAANNLQQQQQVQPPQLATPDPAADYLRSGEICALCLLAVALSSVGALLLGLALTTIPCRLERASVVCHSDADEAAFVAELEGGFIALVLGCVCAAFLALRCCRGSHSWYGGS